MESIPQDADLILIKTGWENQRMPALESGHIFHELGLGPDIGYLLRKNLKLKMIVFVLIVLTSFANHE